MCAAEAPGTTRWYLSVWFVLLALFVLLGPLGLPLLWRSPRFPLWAKILLTCVMIGWIAWMSSAIASIIRSASYDAEQLRLIMP